MKFHDLVWDDIRVASACSQYGSLSGAARKLNMSVATVGRRLDRLETVIGRKLFHRHSGGLRENPDAELLLERAQRVADEVGHFLRATSTGTEVEGEVIVSTLETVLHYVITPRLAEFHQQYPRVRLVLRASYRLVRLDRGAADIAVRVVRPSEPRLVGRRLATLGYGLYASIDYVRRHGRPDPSDLSAHSVAMFDEAWDGLPEMQWLRDRMNGHRPALRLNTMAAIHATIQSGVTVGLVPTALASTELICLAGPVGLPTRDLWLVMHEDLRDAAHVRVVADFIASVVAGVFG